MREALVVLGYESENFAGHSFHIGAATTVAEVGIKDGTIKPLGWWQNNAYQSYVRISTEYLATISGTLAQYNIVNYNIIGHWL